MQLACRRLNSSDGKGDAASRYLGTLGRVSQSLTTVHITSAVPSFDNPVGTQQSWMLSRSQQLDSPDIQDIQASWSTPPQSTCSSHPQIQVPHVRASADASSRRDHILRSQQSNVSRHPRASRHPAPHGAGNLLEHAGSLIRCSGWQSRLASTWRTSPPQPESDLVEVLHTLVRLNLGNDLDATTAGAKHLTDVINVLTRADERSGDVVNAVYQAEVDEVVLILLRQSGQQHLAPGEVHVLTLAQSGRVVSTANDTIVLDLRDVTPASHRPPAPSHQPSRTVAAEVRRQLDERVLLDRHLVLVGQETRTDLGAFRVQHDGHVLVGTLGQRATQASQAGQVAGVVAVREVEAGHVHAGINELQQTLLGPAGRAQRTEDLGLALRALDVGHDAVDALQVQGQSGRHGGGGRKRHLSGLCSNEEWQLISEVCIVSLGGYICSMCA
ncbi:hypothetical protein GQ600_19231 [Phytophthora cactorum]|nr:hypothetical protein GQ600_19231 [Phytophthora cactorum]